MKLSDALEVYFKENYSSTDFDALFIREVKKLEDQLEECGKTPKLLQENTVGELIAEGLEEVADTVASTQEEYRGYVIRVQNSQRVLGYVYDTSDGYGYRDYQDRHVFDTMTEAEQVRRGKKLLSGVYARVIPNGSREYCRDVEAFVQPAYMG